MAAINEITPRKNAESPSIRKSNKKSGSGLGIEKAIPWPTRSVLAEIIKPNNDPPRAKA